MNNATFRIIADGKAHKTLVRGDSAADAIHRAYWRFPVVKRATAVTAELIRTHAVVIVMGGALVHGPFADDEPQAHDALLGMLAAQYPNTSREHLTSAFERLEYVLE